MSETDPKVAPIKFWKELTHIIETKILPRGLKLPVAFTMLSVGGCVLIGQCFKNEHNQTVLEIASEHVPDVFTECIRPFILVCTDFQQMAGLEIVEPGKKDSAAFSRVH
jgi:hypothetical protein